jgi:hypothetical protein
MPTTDIYVNTGQSAGEECSSTYEGRHVTFEESVITHPTHADGFVDKGDPCIVGEQVFIAFNGASAATDIIANDTEGIWWGNVVATDDLGNSAVARGDRIYINRTTCVLSKISSPATHLFFGIAEGVVASGSTDVCAVKVHEHPNSPQIDPTYLIVSKSGNDTYGKGTWSNPLLTIQAALDLCTATRKTIYVLDGTYDEALTWPTITGVKLIGMNREFGVVLTAPLAADQVIDVTPGAQAATFEMWLENLYIDHSTVAGQDGVLLDNTAMTKKLNCYIRDCGGDADSASDSFITMTHGDADNAIRVYWEGNNGGVEGRIYFDVGNNGDRFYATNVVFNGGFVSSADAIVTDFRFIRCTILHEGVTGGNAAQVITSVISYSNTGATFAKIDTADLAGSHTEVIVD